MFDPRTKIPDEIIEELDAILEGVQSCYKYESRIYEYNASEPQTERVNLLGDEYDALREALDLLKGINDKIEGRA